MWPPILGLILFIILLLIIGTLFLLTVVEILVNGILIYLAGSRSLKELNRGWLKEYGIGALIAIAIIAVKGNIVGVLWPFTTWLILTFLAAQLIHAVTKK